MLLSRLNYFIWNDTVQMPRYYIKFLYVYISEEKVVVNYNNIIIYYTKCVRINVIICETVQQLICLDK